MRHLHPLRDFLVISELLKHPNKHLERPFFQPEQQFNSFSSGEMQSSDERRSVSRCLVFEDCGFTSSSYDRNSSQSRSILTLSRWFRPYRNDKGQQHDILIIVDSIIRFRPSGRDNQFFSKILFHQQETKDCRGTRPGSQLNWLSKSRKMRLEFPERDLHLFFFSVFLFSR